jgi:Co/Zn/Cd efflux system component
MNAVCCSHCDDHDPGRGGAVFRRVLWAVLAINAAMFAIEVGAGLMAGSASLQADALDFLGDAANYAVSLFVVGMALRYRATTALAKGATMGAFGLWVLGITGWHAWHGTLPQAVTMGAVGSAALVANAASFGLLWKYREGDANMRSAWILYAQRRARQPSGATRSGRGFRYWNGLAGFDSRGDHGGPRSTRGRRGGPASVG